MGEDFITTGEGRLSEMKKRARQTRPVLMDWWMD